MGMYDMFKDAISMAQKADNIELVRAIIYLQQETLELQEKCSKLGKENKELKAIIDEVKSIKFKNNCYYFDEDGPYCTKCYDDEKKRMHMIEKDNNKGSIYYVCPKCKTEIFARESGSMI